MERYPPAAPRRRDGLRNVAVMHADGVVLVTLSGGVRAMVDAPAWTRLLNHYTWHAQWSRGRWVQRTNLRCLAGECRRTAYAHVLVALLAGVITDAGDARVVDHRNHDARDARLIDNRLANLRPATVQQNAACARYRAGRSGYRGVKQRSPGSWVASIVVAKRTIHLGSFPSADAAATAYNDAAQFHFGEFAAINTVVPF